MFGLVVIEGMTLSGHPWIINEIRVAEVHWNQDTVVSCTYLQVGSASE